jgi:hypothetical protein
MALSPRLKPVGRWPSPSPSWFAHHLVTDLTCYVVQATVRDVTTADTTTGTIKVSSRYGADSTLVRDLRAAGFLVETGSELTPRKR